MSNLKVYNHAHIKNTGTELDGYRVVVKGFFSEIVLVEFYESIPEGYNPVIGIVPACLVQLTH